MAGAHFGSDISIASPVTANDQVAQAQKRLEAICKIIGPEHIAGSGHEDQQEGLANVFEEIVFSQNNKYD